MASSPLAAVHDALRALSAAGPISARPPPPGPPRAPSGKAGKNVQTSSSALLELLDSFPSFRPALWSGVVDALAAARVPSKYVRRLGDELGYALQVAGALTRSWIAGPLSADSPGASLLARLRPWLWVASALVARLSSQGGSVRASAGGAGAAAQAQAQAAFLPACLGDEPGSAFGAASSFASTSSSAAAAAAAAAPVSTALSRLDDVVPLVQAALSFYLALPRPALEWLRTAAAAGEEVSEDAHGSAPTGACPATALAAASVHLLLRALGLQTGGSRKVFATLLNPMRSRLGAEGSSSGGAAAGSAAAAADSTLLALLLRTRDASLGEAGQAAESSSSPSSSPLYLSQLSSLAAAVESAVEGGAFAPDVLPHLEGSLQRAVLLGQESTLVYSAKAASVAGAASKEPAPSADAQNPPAKRGKGSTSAPTSAPAAAAAVAPLALYRLPVVSTERKLFDLLCGTLAAGDDEQARPAAAAAGASTSSHASSSSSSALAASSAPLLRSAPFLLTAFIRARRAAAAEASAAAGPLAIADLRKDKDGSAAAEVAAAAKKRQRGPDGEPLAGTLAAAAAQSGGIHMAAVASLQRHPEFAFAAELLAVCIGYDPATAGARAAVARAAGSGGGSSASPFLPLPAPAAATKADVALLALRLRTVAALLTVVAECGAYSVHTDGAPHTLTAVLSGVYAWVVEAVQLLARVIALPAAAPGAAGSSSASSSLLQSDPNPVASATRAAIAACSALLELNHAVVSAPSASVRALEALAGGAGSGASAPAVVRAADPDESSSPSAASPGVAALLLGLLSAANAVAERAASAQPLADDDDDELGTGAGLADACSMLLAHTVSVFARLRQLEVLLDAYGRLCAVARPEGGVTALASASSLPSSSSSSSALSSTFLHRVWMGEAHTRALSSALRTLPPGQVWSIGDALLGQAQVVAVRARRDAQLVAAVLTLGARKGGKGKARDADDDEEDEEDDDAGMGGVDDDEVGGVDEAILERATSSALVAHAYASFVAEYLRQLAPTPSTALRCLNAAVRAGYGFAAVALVGAGELRAVRSLDSPLYVLTAAGLRVLLAATDVAVTCAPYPSVASFAPMATAVLDPRVPGTALLWPLDRLRQAAVAVGSVPDGPRDDDFEDDAELATSGASLRASALGAALSQAYAKGGASEGAATSKKAAAAAPLSSLPRLDEVVGWTLESPRRRSAAPRHSESESALFASTFQPLPAAREACLLVSASRLRLLHALQCARALRKVAAGDASGASGAADADALASRTLAHHLLLNPTYITAGALEVCARYSQPGALAHFMRDALDPTGDAATAQSLGATTTVIAPWRSALLRDARLYELAPLAVHVTAAAGNHAREALRALLACFTLPAAAAKKGSGSRGAASSALLALPEPVLDAASKGLAGDSTAPADLARLLAVLVGGGAASASAGLARAVTGGAAASRALEQCERLGAALSLLASLPVTAHESASRSGAGMPALLATCVAAAAVSRSIRAGAGAAESGLVAASDVVNSAALRGLGALASAPSFPAAALSAVGGAGSQGSAALLAWCAVEGGRVPGAVSPVAAFHVPLLGAEIEFAVASAATGAAGAGDAGGKKERRKAVGASVTRVLAGGTSPQQLVATLSASAQWAETVAKAAASGAVADRAAVKGVLSALEPSLAAVTASSASADDALPAALRCVVALAVGAGEDAVDAGSASGSLVGVARGALGAAGAAGEALRAAAVRSLDLVAESSSPSLHASLSVSLVTWPALQASLASGTPDLFRHAPAAHLAHLREFVSASSLAWSSSRPAAGAVGVFEAVSACVAVAARAHDAAFFARGGDAAAAEAGGATADNFLAPGALAADTVASGTIASRDAVVALVRGILPPLAASLQSLRALSAAAGVRSASSCPVAAALRLLRVLVASPRLVPLPPADLSLVLQGLSILQEAALHTRAVGAAAGAAIASAAAAAAASARKGALAKSRGGPLGSAASLPVDALSIDIGLAYGSADGSAAGALALTHDVAERALRTGERDGDEEEEEEEAMAAAGSKKGSAKKQSKAADGGAMDEEVEEEASTAATSFLPSSSSSPALAPSTPMVACAPVYIAALAAAAAAEREVAGESHAAPSSSSSSTPRLPSLLFTDAALAEAGWLLHALLKHRRDSALAALPAIASSLQAAAAVALTPVPGVREHGAFPSDAALAPLVRACEQFGRIARVARYQVVQLLAKVLELMAAPVSASAAAKAAGSAAGAGGGAAASSALPATVRAAVTPGVYALLDACGPKELQQLHTMLAARPAARTLLKSAHKDYEGAHKYTGMV
jgi:hypothetical protein